MRGRQRLKFQDSLSTCWEDQVSPTPVDHQGCRGQIALAWSPTSSTMASTLSRVEHRVEFETVVSTHHYRDGYFCGNIYGNGACRKHNLLDGVTLLSAISVRSHAKQQRRCPATIYSKFCQHWRARDEVVTCQVLAGSCTEHARAAGRR